MFRRLVLALIASLIFSASAINVSAAEANNHRVLRVMTRNMDAGSDFWYVLAAAQNPNSTQFDLLVAITQTFLEMHNSNIAQRADGIASEIEATHPDLIGLQEVTVLSTGDYLQPPSTIVDDTLASLRAALRKRGLHYVPLKIQKNAQVVLPALDSTFTNLIDVGFTDYDVVLARSDLPVSELRVEDVQAKHFNSIVNFTVDGMNIPFVRGWIAVDAQLRGKEYRFVTTHLETFSNDYQAAQTEELLSGPLDTELPTILAADLNSDAYEPSFENGPAYDILIDAGFQDAWPLFHPNDPGFTWPMYVEDSGIGPHSLQRIDLVLDKGADIRPQSIEETGTAPIDGLWSSDHTGVEGTLVLLP